jgi:hypothetical protein
METILMESLTKRRRGYIRSGRVKVEPIRRSSDWLPADSDSAFMNTGAKVEYVVPRLLAGQLLDPLGDLNDEQKNLVARELGFKNSDDLNTNRPEKQNFWVNRSVFIDKNGKFLDLSNIGDFISYKILEVNLETIAPSFTDRYEKGTYKFALVFESEESKLKNTKVDAKKDAYMLFGKIDGSVKKMTDFLWIYYLTDREAKRLPNNPGMDFLRGEVGRIIEEKTGTFLSIMTDPDFETKVLIQKAVNNGFIHREGTMFTVFGEPTSKNTLEGLVNYLKDDRNNNIRLTIIGRLDALENLKISEIKEEIKNEPVVIALSKETELLKRMEQLEEITKEYVDKSNQLLLTNNDLQNKNQELAKHNEQLLRKIAMLEITPNIEVINKNPIIEKKGRPFKPNKE